MATRILTEITGRLYARRSLRRGSRDRKGCDSTVDEARIRTKRFLEGLSEAIRLHCANRGENATAQLLTILIGEKGILIEYGDI